MVHPVDATSAQLRGYLENSKDIIISTIQKFSVIAEEIGKLKSKTFAVIIDEAHSSQSGESARNLRTSLSKGIEEEVTDEDDADEVSDIDARILEEMEGRRMQDHISYFGFSGTPKNKTLELFGRKDARTENLSRSTSIRCARASAKASRLMCCRTTPPLSGTFNWSRAYRRIREYEKGTDAAGH